MLFSQCFEINECRWHLHNFSSVIHSKTLIEKSIMGKLFIENTVQPEMLKDKGVELREVTGVSY